MYCNYVFHVGQEQLWDLFDKDTNIGAALIKMSVNVNSQVKHEVNLKPMLAGNINVLNKAELLAGTEMLTTPKCICATVGRNSHSFMAMQI